MRRIVFLITLFFGALNSSAFAQTNSYAQDARTIIMAGIDHLRARVDGDFVIDAQTLKEFKADSIADAQTFVTETARALFLPVEKISNTKECRAGSMRMGMGTAYLRFEPPVIDGTTARLRVHATFRVHDNRRPLIIRRSWMLQLERSEKGFVVAHEIGKEFRETIVSQCGW